MTAFYYIYTPCYLCYKNGVKSELRVYNRDETKAHEVIATTTDAKKILKAHGLKWDKYNHSYIAQNPTDEAVEAIGKIATLTIKNLCADNPA